MHAELDEIKRALLAEHPELKDPLYTQFSRALATLPAGASWMIARAPRVAVFARQEGLLFIVAMNVVAERVSLTSRQIDAESLRVAIEWDDDRPNDQATALIRPTVWTFLYPGPDNDAWREIRGEITIDNTGDQRPDRAESFARAFAAFAGWPQP